MKPTKILAPLALLLALSTAHAQDATNTQPIVSSIDPAKLTYDYLVDGNLPQDDPANKKFKTFQAAYAAAPAGTEAKPTVIGIMPNVYLIPGSLDRAPSLAINKNWITLLGLTNNRRAVVLADNRGLEEGASDDGYLLDVNATGFTCKNLTLLNYCNTDYQYPGDPSKNLKMRSPTITQAVALQTAGDKHSFENVALLSRLDTCFLRANRSYFKNVYIEGTDDWMGGGQISVWQDSTLVYPTGRGVMSAANCIFLNCTFEAARGMQWYKAEFGGAARPNALINCTVPVSTPQNPVAWVRGVAIPRPNQYSLTYHNKDAAGNPAVIYDDSVKGPAFTYSRELSDAELLAFNPWNLLRGNDNWDPAGVKDKYAAAGNLVYRMTLTTGAGANRGARGGGGGAGGGAAAPAVSATIRTGGPGVTLGASVQPANAADKTITWSTKSDLVSLSATTGPTITVTAKNTTEDPQYIPITAKAANGFYITAYVYAEPKFIEPPKITAAPKISAPAAGKVSVDYTLDLAGREDQSLITWYTCDDAAGANPLKVAVTRGTQPLKTYTLMPADAGRYVRATIEPKHHISDPGPAVTATVATPIAAADVPSASVTADFRNFVETPTTPLPGRWTVLGNWTILPGEKYTNGYGIRSVAGTGAAGAQGPAALLYFKDGPATNMQIDLVMTPDKTEGTVFAVPGSPAETAGRNSHGDIFIKYDPRTRTGYSLRYWRTIESAAACTYQFYKITNGVGTPLTDKKIQSGVFRQNTLLTLKVAGSTLSVSAKNTVDDQKLDMDAPFTPNDFAGAGVSSTGAATVYSLIKVSYP